MAKITTHTAQRHVMRGDGVLGNEVPGSAVQAGILELDGNAADIQPTGAVAAAGTTGLAADAGHVHAGMSLLATTGASGYALVNGTGNIITWTAPNDGALHRVIAVWNLHVTSGETGGQLGVAYTLPDTTVTSFPGAISAGGASTGTSVSQNTYFVQAGTTFSVKQNSALTGGAAVLWVDLWGS